MTMSVQAKAPYNKIIEVSLDESTGMGSSFLPPEVEEERQRAIADLLADNDFHPVNRVGMDEGPYRLILKVVEQRLVLEIYDKDNSVYHIGLSLKPFRRIMQDYAMVCDSYYRAVHQASVQKIEALDMGRRGLHDEGATILQNHLEGKIECDFKTARRLFTLMYCLFIPSLR